LKDSAATNPLEIMDSAGNKVTASRMHHVGYVVASIQETVRGFAESIRATWDEQIFADPNQVVRVTFLAGNHPHDPQVELIEPNGPNSPVLAFLKKGGGLHHLCYEVSSLEAELEFSRRAGGIVVKRPLPAVAFGGRRIAWVFTKNKLLIEYLET